MSAPVPGGAIYGKPGTGKSWLAACLFRRMAEGVRKYNLVHCPGQSLMEDLLWLTVPSWFHDLRRKVAQRDGFDRAVQDASTFPIVCFDDIGAERATDWTADTLYVVISTREAEGLPIIATTNLSLEQLNDWNPRLASRLARYPRLTMSGKDRRL